MSPDLVSLYRQMLRSRRFEELVGKIWAEGNISAEMHLNIGEEGIIAGVVDHLGDNDAMALDHRGTAPLLMRGTDMALLLKEFLGRKDGLCHGRGGHMHLFAPEILSASSGIVGASGPAACGFAYAAQLLRPDSVAVAFFGEGAMNQGMLMEAINLASCWTLPVLFVCKDNGMAITTPSPKVTGGDLLERARGLGANAVTVDGTDVEKVWQEAGEAVIRAREGEGPTFLHATCLRPEGHFLGDPLLRITRKPIRELKDKIGPLTKAALSSGASLGKRTASLSTITSILSKAAGMQIARQQDPVAKLRLRLSLPTEELTALEEEIAVEVEKALQTATSPLEEISE